MRKVKLYRSRFLGMVVVFWLVFSALPTTALEPEPHPLDTFLTAILSFRDPTGIRGTHRYIAKEEQGIWLNWEQRSDDRPLFDTDWKLVPEDTTFLVNPQDSAQYKELEQIAKGTAIEMVIQFDPKGHRRILSYQNLSQLRKIPL